MHRTVLEPGTQVGGLTILGTFSYRGQSSWTLSCDCGQTVVRNRNQLFASKEWRPKDCGCGLNGGKRYKQRTPLEVRPLGPVRSPALFELRFSDYSGR